LSRGRYANLGPEVLADAGVVLVVLGDRVGALALAVALATIADDQRIRMTSPADVQSAPLVLAVLALQAVIGGTTGAFGASGSDGAVPLG
jgi:hypothetical protein